MGAPSGGCQRLILADKVAAADGRRNDCRYMTVLFGNGDLPSCSAERRPRKGRVRVDPAGIHWEMECRDPCPAPDGTGAGGEFADLPFIYRRIGEGERVDIFEGPGTWLRRYDNWELCT